MSRRRMKVSLTFLRVRHQNQQDVRGRPGSSAGALELMAARTGEMRVTRACAKDEALPPKPNAKRGRARPLHIMQQPVGVSRPASSA
jgi:hypothetical protein